jgi:hypothetical protein
LCKHHLGIFQNLLGKLKKLFVYPVVLILATLRAIAAANLRPLFVNATSAVV